MDIKLFVCCHEPTEIPKHPLLVPLQVGAILAGEHFSGFLHDDTGGHISQKNRSFCELTGQYWVWKNIEADYYGFFHYRRYLYPDLTAKRPYRIEAKPTSKLLEKLRFSGLEPLIRKYDLILPKGEDMYISAEEHYANAPFHYRKDLELVKKILKDLHPEYEGAMETYLSNSVCYFGNIFIMRRKPFQDYCAWLFSILEEFDRRADVSGYSAPERRVNGYLAERLLGVWAEAHSELRSLELPRIHFIPNRVERWKKQTVGFLLPPGSKRRAEMKRLASELEAGRGKCDVQKKMTLRS